MFDVRGKNRELASFAWRRSLCGRGPTSCGISPALCRRRSAQTPAGLWQDALAPSEATGAARRKKALKLACMADMVRARQPPRARAPRPGRQRRVMLLLLLGSAAWSGLVLFLFWPRPWLRPRAPTRTVERLLHQLANSAASGADALPALIPPFVPLMPDPPHASAINIDTRTSVINSSSAEWAAAHRERERRDRKRSADAQTCYTLNGRSYRGRQHITKSGLRCQPWAQQFPNAHRFDPAKLPEADLESNFCRNPSGEAAPWCYNGEGTEPRFEMCSIPLCAQRYEEITVPAQLVSPYSDADASPGAQLALHASDSSSAGRRAEEGRLLKCPATYTVDAAAAQARSMYDSLPSHSKIRADSSPLHFLSFYGGTSIGEWDHIVRAHCERLKLRPGETVFEAGSAAGAFVDSLARQYGVRVAGVDVAPNLVAIARRRVFRGGGMPEFCAASASNLSFIADDSFDHAVSFAVMMYIADTAVACQVASELVRIV